MTQDELDWSVSLINQNNVILKGVKDKILKIALDNDIKVENDQYDIVALLDVIGDTLVNPNSGQPDPEPTNQDYVEYYRHDITIPYLPIVGSYMNGLLTKEGTVSEYTTIYTARKDPYVDFADFWSDVGMDTLVLSGELHLVMVGEMEVTFTLSKIVDHTVFGVADTADVTVSGTVLSTTEMQDTVDTENPIRVYNS